MDTRHSYNLRNRGILRSPFKSSCKTCDAEDNLAMVQCDSCDHWYHFSCVGVDESISDSPWKCNACLGIIDSKDLSLIWDNRDIEFQNANEDSNETIDAVAHKVMYDNDSKHEIGGTLVDRGAVDSVHKFVNVHDDARNINDVGGAQGFEKKKVFVPEKQVNDKTELDDPILIHTTPSQKSSSTRSTSSMRALKLAMLEEAHALKLKRDSEFLAEKYKILEEFGEFSDAGSMKSAQVDIGKKVKSWLQQQNELPSKSNAKTTVSLMKPETHVSTDRRVEKPIPPSTNMKENLITNNKQDNYDPSKFLTGTNYTGTKRKPNHILSKNLSTHLEERSANNISSYFPNERSSKMSDNHNSQVITRTDDQCWLKCSGQNSNKLTMLGSENILKNSQQQCNQFSRRYVNHDRCTEPQQYVRFSQISERDLDPEPKLRNLNKLSPPKDDTFRSCSDPQHQTEHQRAVNNIQERYRSHDNLENSIDYQLYNNDQSENRNRSTQQFALNSRQIAARSAMPKELPNFHGKPEEWPMFISS